MIDRAGVIVLLVLAVAEADREIGNIDGAVFALRRSRAEHVEILGARDAEHERYLFLRLDIEIEVYDAVESGAYVRAVRKSGEVAAPSAVPYLGPCVAVIGCGEHIRAGIDHDIAAVALHHSRRVVSDAPAFGIYMFKGVILHLTFRPSGVFTACAEPITNYNNCGGQCQ